MSGRRRRAAAVLALLALGPVGLAGGAAAAGPNTYDIVTVGANSGEPSLGFDPQAHAVLYQSNTKTTKMVFDDSTVPAGVTRTVVNAPTSVTSLDPILFTDSAIHRTYVSQLALACSLMSYSDDAGATWTPSQGCGEGTLLDHQTVGGGPFHAPVPASAVAPHAVYYCAQSSYHGLCAVSLDGGLTFGPGVSAYNTPANAVDEPDPTIKAEGGACTAIHGHLRVGPDGTAYLPLKGCGGEATAANLTNTEFAGGQPSVVVSTDNGLTWQVHRVPGTHNPDESDPSVAAGRGDTVPGGRVYLGFADGVNTPVATGYGTTTSARVAVSTDHGTTWSTPVDVSTPLGVRNVQFPEMIAGDDDRAAFAWLGTTVAGDDQHNQPAAHPDSIDPTAPWHLYVSTTYDGGATWSTVDTTPTDPVQRGCISLQGTSNRTVNDPPCTQRNLLDFNDITVDDRGRVLVAFADGCTGACVTTPATRSSGAVDLCCGRAAGGACSPPPTTRARGRTCRRRRWPC